MPSRLEYEKITEQLTRDLTDRGLLIEAGFAAMVLQIFPKDLPPQQLRDMRMVFMAGAQHLFGSIMSIMDPGTEPSAADLRRMDLINAELEAFGRELAAALPTKGRA